ncbi:endothelin-converting enzyme 1-like [Oppia nitens]|uniref:endothelin-converting enzyme 1-like n=1 Tax=Oppia nitens TaxID=1686743 RepID=UPI0023DA014A|nr:endothelin-converting enzyme 1-like [Oppia nitens]
MALLCLTSGCVKVAAHILERMDTSVDPCHDFYQYSCGSFIRNNPVPDDHYLKNLLQEIQDEVYFEMRSYLQTEDNLISDGEDNSGGGGGHAVQAIKLLYNSCMNETTNSSSDDDDDDNNDADDDQPMAALFRVFDQIGGQWPLLSPSSTNSSSIDLEHRLASLLLYQVQPLFQFFIEPHQSNKSQYAIHLLYGSTVLESTYLLSGSDDTFVEDSDEIGAYVELQLEIVKLFAKFRNISLISDDNNNNDEESLRHEILEMVRLESELSKITKETSSETNGTEININLDELMTNSDESINLVHLLNNNNNGSNAQTMFLNVTIDEMEDLYKAIKWKKLFSIISTEADIDVDIVLINSRDYLLQLNKLLDSFPLKTIDNYLCWAFVARYMPYLGPQFRRLYSEFRTKVPDMSTESGDPSAASSRVFLSRWKECVHVVSEGLDIPAIVLYLKHKQQELQLKADKITDLIDKIKRTFTEIIDGQSWLKQLDNSVAIRDLFKSRVQSIESKIGVPKMLANHTEVDRMYARLELDAGDPFITNIFKMSRHQMLIELQKLNRLVNPEEEWIIQPLIANAYYDPITNNIIMPPGILRYPLISLERPSYLDFATLGIVIGHEIAHSMGTDSRKLMNYENGTNWWTDEMTDVYMEKAICFADQYSQYLVETTDEYLNGNHTLEENICDFAGLQQSYTAYKRFSGSSSGGHTSSSTPSPPPQLPGLSNYSMDQLFFIQYAQIWCEVVTDEGHRKSLHDDHSPGRFRANGVLVNTEQFSRAFNCPKGSPMNPPVKCGLWNSDQL